MPKGRVRKILTYGHPALRQKAETVRTIDKKIEQLALDLLASMLARDDALALAANQIGELDAIIAINPRSIGVEQAPFVLVNPEVEGSSGAIERSEGCLSLPGLSEVLKRAAKVKVRAQNIKGNAVTVNAEGTLARALLHEIDHLNGILFIDYLSPTRRRLLDKALKELEKKSCE